MLLLLVAPTTRGQVRQLVRRLASGAGRTRPPCRPGQSAQVASTPTVFRTFNLHGVHRLGSLAPGEPRRTCPRDCSRSCIRLMLRSHPRAGGARARLAAPSKRGFGRQVHRRRAPAGCRTTAALVFVGPAAGQLHCQHRREDCSPVRAMRRARRSKVEALVAAEPGRTLQLSPTMR